MTSGSAGSRSSKGGNWPALTISVNIGDSANCAGTCSTTLAYLTCDKSCAANAAALLADAAGAAEAAPAIPPDLAAITAPVPTAAEYDTNLRRFMDRLVMSSLLIE